MFAVCCRQCNDASEAQVAELVVGDRVEPLGSSFEKELMPLAEFSDVRSHIMRTCARLMRVVLTTVPTLV